MKTFSRFFLPTLVIFLSLFLVLASPAMAQTQEWELFNRKCVGPESSSVTGPKGTITTTDATDVATIQGFGCLIANVFSVAIAFIGFAGFVMLVVGSFRYLLSGGNAKGTETARNTMTFAIVGLVVALSAFIILSLIAQFTGVGTIMQFVIPDSDSGMNFSDPVGGAGGKAVISPN